MIALFAQAFSLDRPTAPLSQDLLHLKDLSARRRQLLGEKLREENRLEIPVGDALQKSIQKHLHWLENEIKEIENEIQNHIDVKEEIQHKVQLLSSMKGVGRETSLTLLTHLPEIGTLKNTSLSALVGVAPFNKESGNLSKKRYIFGGRATVRKALYMAAVASLRCNEDMKQFYQKLKAKGKPSKVALVAVAHKILITLNAMCKNKKKWYQNFS